jgi:homoserine kinase type II
MTHARDAGLGFVPRILPSIYHTLRIEYGGRFWELQEWLPGEADYHRRPSLAKRQAACAALARLHTCWPASDRFDAGPYPAVRRRLDAVREWRELVRSGWRPLAHADPSDPARPAVERAWQILSPHINVIPDLLKRWNRRIGLLQPCLCDVWHDHVLFDGDRVTGIVDYGTMKIDHPAVDVGRLLGSLVEDDPAGWATGLAAYRQVRPFTTEEEDLAHALDRTGAIMGIAAWLRRLYHETTRFTDRRAAAQRLGGLVKRIEKWR